MKPSPWPQLLSTLPWMRQALSLDQFRALLEEPKLAAKPHRIGEFLENPKVQNNWVEQAEHWLNLVRRSGYNLVTPMEPSYPSSLLHMDRPPLALVLKGKIPEEANCLSVVGSRVPPGYATEWMDQELRPFIREQSLSIVSGGARGIDQGAHRLALLCNQPTVIVLPSGIKRPYPAQINNWLEPATRGGGAVLSVFAPDAEMQKGFFHYRNRIIAALSQMTLVVSAKPRSGTLITATAAAEMGKKVGVVPGPPTIPAACGALQLIQDGAELIKDRIDLELSFNH